MGDKTSNQGERKPLPYFNEVRIAKKEDKSSAHVVTSLRTDRLPGSHAVPAGAKFHQRVNFKLIGGLLIALMILVLIWYSLAGAGRPLLEQKLVSLLPTATITPRKVDPSPVPATDVLVEPSLTPSSTSTRSPTVTPHPTSTVRPTNTPTIVSTTSPTLISASMTPSTTPTLVSSCRNVGTITLADVGQTLCVQGVVIETIEASNSFMVIFSNQKGALYWVSYDMVWSKVELDACYRVKGTISQLGNSPILLFNYDNIPEECP